MQNSINQRLRTGVLIVAGALAGSSWASSLTDVTAPTYSPVLNNGVRYVYRTYDGQTTGTDPNSAAWLAELSTTGSITWSLGGVQKLDTINVWNYNEAASGNTDRGASNVTVYISSNYGASYTALGSYVVPQAPGTIGITPFAINAGGVNATHVRLEIQGNWGDPSYVGLNEVQFAGTVLTATTNVAIQAVTASNQYPSRDAADVNDGIIYSTDGSTGMWLAQQPGDQVWLRLDTGVTNRIAHLKVWNYNEVGFGSRGISNLQLMVSLDGLNWQFATNAVDNTTSFTLYQAPASLNITPSTLFLAGTPMARYVMLTNVVNYGASGNFVGLTEVQIYALIPEPSTLLLLGVGGLLLARCCRRRNNP